MWMKGRALFAAVLVISPGFAQTAREYYNELYAAGGLDRMVDEYVCFFEKPELKNFFLFGENKLLREHMIENGTFEKLSKEQQAEMKKDILMFRGYNKGVPLANEDYFHADGGSWVSDTAPLDKNTSMRVRFSISWKTLRFKRSVELLEPDGTFKGDVPAYGKCELVPPDVQQTVH